MTLFATLRTPGWRRSVLLRRSLAVTLLLAALVLALREARSSDPEALVFTRPIPPGQALSLDDVRLASVPRHLLPSSALRDPADVQGRVPATSGEVGEVVTATKLVATDLSEGVVGNVTSLVPLRLADPEILPLLRHGDTVNVLTNGDERADSEIIATGGTVILSDTRSSPGTLLVGLQDEDAHRVAAASLGSPLTVVLSTNIPK